MYIDAHSHWSDSRLFENNQPTAEWNQLMQASLKAGVTQFMLGGVNPGEWERQKYLKNRFPEKFYLSFGVHPYFVAENDLPTCEEAVDLLSQSLSDCLAIGEAGLDFRTHLLGADPEVARAQQIQIFENQIEMSLFSKKPLVLHIVRAHEEALRLLRFQDSSLSGLVHAFNGSWEIAQEYLKLGFYISVGGAVTFIKNEKLRKAVKEIPEDRLLLESDMPDQPPQAIDFPNNSSSLVQIAQEIGQIRGCSADQILMTSTNNFKRLFRL